MGYTSEFYARRGSVFGFSEEYGRDDDGDLIFHAGQDIRADAGDPIPFPGSRGRVSVVGYGLDAGWFASIAVEGQYHQFYHQIQRPPLDVGQLLTFDDILGRVGSTGKAFGPHLHYAVSSNPYPGPGGNRVDPWPIIQRMLAANGAGSAGGDTTPYPEGDDVALTAAQEAAIALIPGIIERLDDAAKSITLIGGVNQKLDWVVKSVSAQDDDEGKILAAIAGIRPGTGTPVDLTPVLALIRNLPTETVAALKAAL